MWGGLDIGDYTTRLCITDSDGLPIFESDCETAPHLIVEAMAAFPPSSFAKIAMEAGSHCHDIALHLRAAGFPIAVYDARRVNRFLSARAAKTDTNDARGIAQVARLGKHGLREVHVKSRAIQELRNEIVLRDCMVRQRMVAEASLKNAFRVYGIRIGSTKSAKVLRERAEAGILALDAGDQRNLAQRLSPLLDLCTSLRAYEAHQNRALLKRASEIEITRRFLSIPSVGPICALSFYSAIEDPKRFACSSDVGPYLGLVPRTMQSGKMLRMGRITKFGNDLTRTHLALSARSLLSRHTKAECTIRTWGLSLAEKSGFPKARIAVARKLAIVMIAMWKNGTAFEPLGG
jgi:transposase